MELLIGTRSQLPSKKKRTSQHIFFALYFRKRGITNTF